MVQTYKLHVHLTLYILLSILNTSSPAPTNLIDTKNNIQNNQLDNFSESQITSYIGNNGHSALSSQKKSAPTLGHQKLKSSRSKSNRTKKLRNTTSKKSRNRKNRNRNKNNKKSNSRGNKSPRKSRRNDRNRTKSRQDRINAEIKRGLKDLQEISKRVTDLGDNLPPIKDKKGRDELYAAKRHLKAATGILTVELEFRRQQLYYKRLTPSARTRLDDNLVKNLSAFQLKNPNQSIEKPATNLRNSQFNNGKLLSRVGPPTNNLRNRFQDSNSNRFQNRPSHYSDNGADNDYSVEFH